MPKHRWKNIKCAMFGNQRLINYLLVNHSIGTKPCVDVDGEAIRAILDRAETLGLDQETIAFLTVEKNGDGDLYYIW
jgi:hypothetical protein